MPWIPLDNTPGNIGVEPKAPAEPVDLAAPSTGETWSAAFRQGNSVGSAASNKMWAADFDTVTPGFDPWKAAKGTPLEAYPDRVASIFNQQAFDTLAAQVQMEEQDKRTLDAAGWAGTLAQVAAGVLDWPTLIPAGRLVQAGRLGYDVTKSAATVATATAGGVLAQEEALQATQQTRPATQSAIAVGGGALLGGLLGAGGAKLLDNVAWNNAARALEQEVYAPTPIAADIAETEMKGLIGEAAQPTAAAAPAGAPASAGAAAVDAPSLEGLTVYGKVARVATNATAQLNPLLRALTSPSAETRNILLNLMENPVYLKANYGGQASARAVETIVKAYEGAYVRTVEDMRGDWRAARQAGDNIKWDEYRARVGQAMRTGDTDAGGSDFITASAQKWRAQVFDPLKQKAIDAGLLPEDVSVETAQSYFTRMYNVRKIEAREGEFKQIVREWAGEQIAAQIKAAAPDSEIASMSKMELDSYIEDVVSSIYNKVTGRAVDAQGESPFRIVANTRGPLKERTFNIADEKIAPFLLDDIEMVGRRYTRVMGADIELSNVSRRLGGDGRPDMKALIARVRADYEKLRAGVTDEKQLGKLSARERADIRDMEAVRDMLRGQYLAQQNSSGWAKVVNAAMTFNYMRTMGGVTLSSLTDVARPIMVHGLRRWIGDGVKPLVTNLRGFKMAAREAKLAGVVGERVKNATLATYAELADPYSTQSPFQRFLDNTARMFSTATLMPMWNDFQKSFASVITQNRILGDAAGWAKLSEKERAYMNFLGIDQPMAERIISEFNVHGEMIDGVRAANTESWTDNIAREAYRAAIAKDVDSIIVTKAIGDVPLFARTPTGRALLQFKGFALAAHQRAFMRGLQEDQAAMVSGLIASTTIGAFIYYLKTMEAGRIEDLSDNPGRFLAEGLDRGSMFPLLFEVNNVAEKIGAPGVYSALQMAFPDKTQKQPASRYATRSVVDSYLGPSVGAAKDVADLAGAALKADLMPSDIAAMRRLMPGASLPWFRAAIDNTVVPWLKDSVE